MIHVPRSLTPKVVIVGGGFAGLSCARGLAKSPVEITLADKNNYHLFQPLLYQVATAVLSPADIATPIRRVLRNQKNTTVVLDELTGVDLNKRLAHFKQNSMPYDYLILANGATHSYFGRDEWAEHAPGLKTVDDALEIRRRVLLAYEEAEWEADPVARQAKLTFVVVGGGPTGVELAGALKEIAAKTVPQDFRHIDTTTARVLLVEAGPRLLAALPERLALRAQRDLEKMGVQVLLNSRVGNICSGVVSIENKHFPAENIIWAAGVKGSDINLYPQAEHDPQGRLLVTESLTLPGHPEVFIIGDMAHASDVKTGKPVPGVAPAAMQMGRFVAGIIRRESIAPSRIEDRPTFSYKNKGSMATIGRNRAVAQVSGKQFGGFSAWLLWGLVHLIPLFGFRNKLSVIFSWLWSYLSVSKNCRLITGQPEMKVNKILKLSEFRCERAAMHKSSHDEKRKSA